MLAKKEPEEDKWGFGPAKTPSFMKSTVNSRIKVKGYDIANEKKFKKAFPMGDKFFELEPYRHLEPDSLTYPGEIGINIHHKDSKGWSILQWAAQNDTTPYEVFESLIELGADVNTVQGDNWTPLRMYLYKNRH